MFRPLSCVLPGGVVRFDGRLGLVSQRWGQKLNHKGERASGGSVVVFNMGGEETYLWDGPGGNPSVEVLGLGRLIAVVEVTDPDPAAAVESEPKVPVSEGNK